MGIKLSKEYRIKFMIWYENEVSKTYLFKIPKGEEKDNQEEAVSEEIMDNFLNWSMRITHRFKKSNESQSRWNKEKKILDMWEQNWGTQKGEKNLKSSRE